MKSAAELNKDGRKSLSSCSDEESKRSKFEKAKKQYPKIKGNKDVFCWTCHRSGNIATCSRCPRAYHLKCGHLEKIPEPNKKWICPECDTVQRANNQTSNSQLKVLSQMLGYVIERMKQVKGSEDFCVPVDTNKWHDYLDYVIKPMDIPKLADNVRRHQYKSTEAFLADFRWLVHDSYVYNSVHSAYTKIAKSMSAVAKQECEEIKNCADCYLHAYSLGENEWFVEPCTTPHILVWAQLSGFPYWPGKVMRHVTGDLVDVRFFGDHSRANVPVTSCFLYSRLMPCTVKKNHPKIANGIEEAEEHVKRLKSLYGTFYYAQYRIRYIPRDEDVIRKLQLPGLRRPDETPEFLKKVELERVDKMILDRDFQSEMKQMFTQKKTLVPAKRKSVEQSPKEGSKRMLVQLNTPMGPKCAIMNWSGSESDSSPKHVSEQMVENTKSSLFNSSIGSQLNTAPTKRMRLSDKLESHVKRTPQKMTESVNDAMIRQVAATSLKELADIYKITSPDKPKTPIKDTGILESISRKLLIPCHVSVQAVNDQLNEVSPPRTISEEEQKSTISSSCKPRQNGFQKKFKGFSTESQEDTDGDSDALVIASRESSPARNADEMSPRNENSLETNSPMVSGESGNRVLDSNSSAEKVEEKGEACESTKRVLDSDSSSDKVNEQCNSDITESEDKGPSTEKIEEKCESKNRVVDGDFPAEKVKEKCETSEFTNCLLDSDSSVDKVDEKGKSKVIECQENTCAETAAPANMVENEPPENDDSLVVESEVSNASDSGRGGILDLLNGDLTHLYDNLKSQCSVSDDNVINDTINATSETDQLEEPRSELNVVSMPCSSSISSSLQILDSTANVSKEPGSQLSVLSISSCSSISPSLKRDRISHDYRTNDEKADDRSSEDPREVGIGTSKEELVKTTETVVDRGRKCAESLPHVENVLSSSAIGNSDVTSRQTDELVKDNSPVESVCSESIKDQTCASTSSEIKLVEPSKLLSASDESAMSVERSTLTSSKDDGSEIPMPVPPSSDVMEESVELLEKSSPLCKNCPPVQDCDSRSSAPVLPSSDLSQENMELLVKSSPLPEQLSEPQPPKVNEVSTSDKLSISRAVSKDLSDGDNKKDIQPKASDSIDLLEMTVEPVDETEPVKSSEVQKPQTTIIFTNSVSTPEHVLKKKSVETEQLVKRRSSVGSSDGKVIEKSSIPPKVKEGRSVPKRQVPPGEGTDENKSKVIGTSASNVASVGAAQNQSENFVTITSTMSLSHLSASTSARTQPVTRPLKSPNPKDPAPAKRKAAEAPSAAVKKPKVKEVNKDVIASGMPPPIIVKVEPVDEIHEILDSPPPLTSKAAPSCNTKPCIKVVQLSNLMEHPLPADVNRNCATPKNNVPSKRITGSHVEKKSSGRLDANKEDETSTNGNSCSKDHQKMIPPFIPKKDMSDVRALIEAKKQFISAKLKADVYEMLDEIKAEYNYHIELLTNVSDRYLQHFESTFETDKTKLYEDFKNKLREQMDQQITEIKRKQWCANCGAEASFHCCWNHAYCGDKCQKEDWSSHTQVCTQYNMSATDPYIRASPRFKALLEKQNANGPPRKISLQDLIDVPVAVSIQSSPPKLHIKKTKTGLGSMSTYSQVPTISIPDSELPELPKPPPSAKSFLTAPVQRLNNGEQISFDNGKRAYRIIQNPVTQKTLKVVGTPSRNQSAVNTYSGPLMRLGGQNRSFALVVGSDTNAKRLSSPSQSYGSVTKSSITSPSTSGNQVSRFTTKTLTLGKKIAPAPVSLAKKSPTVRVMEDNELAFILKRNHLRDTYMHTSL